MKRSTVRILAPLLFSILFGRSAHAEPLKDFLVSCAYGTVAGALVGVASLAFSDDPGSKMNNIARGASLGLYAGIGFGLYVVYGNPNGNAGMATSSDLSRSSPVWLQAQWHQSQIEGISLQTTLMKF